MTTFDRHTATIYHGEASAAAKECTITLDRGWSPFVQGTVRVKVDAGILPRKGDRMRVEARQVFGESVPASVVSAEHAGKTAAQMSTLWAGKTAAEVSALYFTPWNSFGLRSSTRRSFDLTVRAVRTDVRARETVVTLASDELAAQGFALVQNIPETFGSLSVRAVVTQVLTRMGAQLGAGTADGTLEMPATWEPGEPAWDFLAPLVQQAGLRLWCDERRAWHLEADDATTPGSITLASDARVTDAEIGENLDSIEWADAVVIRYRWKDAAGVEQTRYDVAGANRPRKCLRIEYDDTPYPGPGAAAQVLRRRLRLGRSVNVTAVSDYTVVPGMACTVNVAGYPEQAGVVQSVEWRFPAAVMTVQPAGLEPTGGA